MHSVSEDGLRTAMNDAQSGKGAYHQVSRVKNRKNNEMPNSFIAVVQSLPLGLQPDLAEQVAALLPPNEAALAFRLTHKATAASMTQVDPYPHPCEPSHQHDPFSIYFQVYPPAPRAFNPRR